MRGHKGVTLTSLTVYIIAMVIVVATIAVMTKYFYGNLDYLTDRNQVSKEYTSFNSYFTTDINTKGIKVLYCEGNIIAFSNGNQYTFQGNTIYMNKIAISNNVESCEFIYDSNDESKISVELNIGGKDYNNEYTLK